MRRLEHLHVDPIIVAGFTKITDYNAAISDEALSDKEASEIIQEIDEGWQRITVMRLLPKDQLGCVTAIDGVG